ncbi:MAG: hypothetical protein AB8B91_00285 [Rubripirellula sp.]
MFSYSRSLGWLCLTTLAAACSSGMTSAQNADPIQNLFQEDPNLQQVEKPGVQAPLDIPADQIEQVEAWIEELSSNHFATRERVANRLIEVGKPIVPRLRKLAKEADDPEVRVRANEIITRLTRGDIKTRMEDFIAGEDVGFEGWRTTRTVLGGDTVAIREVFVEIMQAHPELTASMDGHARDRAIAMDKAVTKIQDAMFIKRQFPTRADAFALLLPTVDVNVPMNAAFESLLLSVIQKDAATKIKRDAQLATPFKRLLGRWMVRSTLASRDEVLLMGMRWDVERTLPLAMQTLGEANQTEVLAIALQAIARYGTEQHVPRVSALINDTRPAAELGFADGKPVRAQICDVAMATIAMLYNVPLKEVGFSHAEPHPVYSFQVEQLGFPEDDNTARDATRERVRQLIAEPPTPEGS